MRARLGLFYEPPDNVQLNKTGVVKLIKLYRGDVMIQELACDKTVWRAAHPILGYLST